MKKKYTSSDIEVLKGIEPVQKRPGMYTDTSNPNHLVQELIDNSVDEAISGFCNSILITLDKDNSITVEDDGRGMPVDKHPEHKVSGVEVIMTNLHSGAKFSNKNYKFSGGLHGVGVSIVNALSAMLEISVYRLDSKKEHRMSFLNGSIKKKLGEIYGTDSVVSIYGKDSVDLRNKAVETFQSDDRCRFLVGNPTVGGYGLTLTAAKYVIYFSNSYNLEVRWQSEDRAHRYGQTSQVTYIDLIATDTIDEMVLHNLENKIELSAKTLGEQVQKWL